MASPGRPSVRRLLGLAVTGHAGFIDETCVGHRRRRGRLRALRAAAEAAPGARHSAPDTARDRGPPQRSSGADAARTPGHLRSPALHRRAHHPRLACDVASRVHVSAVVGACGPWPRTPAACGLLHVACCMWPVARCHAHLRAHAIADPPASTCTFPIFVATRHFPYSGMRRGSWPTSTCARHPPTGPRAVTMSSIERLA